MGNESKVFWLLGVLLFGVPVAVALLERLINRITGGGLGWKMADGMPTELATAEVFMNESPVSLSHPFASHGRVDQVFLTRRGVLVVLDTKYRMGMRVKESDILQLSCYAVALRQSCDWPVAAYGYVRLVNVTGERRAVDYRRVRLLGERAIARRLVG
ncbi:DUF2800 domain-containing protein [Diaphorobacter sp. DS2]|jgi:hypothetical protein|nr:DUF2800 domain-containing protein [Diaphorobacter sp. DS2]